MLTAEARDKTLDFVQRFKLAVVSADPRTWVPEMFPRWVDPEPEEVTVEEVDFEDTDGAVWEFTEEVDPEDAERMLQELMTQGGTVSLTEADDVGAGLGDDEGWV